MVFIVLTIGKIKEVKQVAMPRKNPFLYMKEFHPLKEIRYSIIDDIKEIENEVKDSIKETKKLGKKGVARAVNW